MQPLPIIVGPGPVAQRPATRRPRFRFFLLLMFTVISAAILGRAISRVHDEMASLPPASAAPVNTTSAGEEQKQQEEQQEASVHEASPAAAPSEGKLYNIKYPI